MWHYCIAVETCCIFQLKVKSCCLIELWRSCRGQLQRSMSASSGPKEIRSARVCVNPCYRLCHTHMISGKKHYFCMLGVGYETLVQSKQIFGILNEEKLTYPVILKTFHLSSYRLLRFWQLFWKYQGYIVSSQTFTLTGRHRSLTKPLISLLRRSGYHGSASKTSIQFPVSAVDWWSYLVLSVVKMCAVLFRCLKVWVSVKWSIRAALWVFARWGTWGQVLWSRLTFFM